MPTLMLFKAGEVVGQIVGAVPRAKIEVAGRARARLSAAPPPAT